MRMFAAAGLMWLGLMGAAHAAIGEQTLNLSPTERYYPLHTGSGDRDYGGNGPLVNVRATLTKAGNCLNLSVTMLARETKHDWTEARLSDLNRQIWCAPAGTTLLSIVSPATVAVGAYSDTDWEVDTIVPGVGEVDARRAIPPNPSFVRSFIVMGDTNGDIYNNDNDGNDVGPGTAPDEYGDVHPTIRKTSLQVQFAPIRVRVDTGAGVAPAPSTPAPRVAATPQTVQLVAQHTGFFAPPLTRGDAEFGANGPRVDASARLRVQSNNRIVADLSMTATETKPDFTTAQGARSFTVWTAPPGWRIDSINSPLESRVSYTDTDWENDFVYDETTRPGPYGPEPAGAAHAFRFVGDTDGADVGSRTGMQVFFRPISVSLTPLLPTLVRDSDLRPNVMLNVPEGDYTNRMSGGNSCGPNAGSRMLRFYGVNTTYEQFKRRVQSSGNAVSDQSNGTPPGVLRDRLNDMSPGFVHQVIPLGDETKNNAAVRRVVDLLNAGKPVLVMVGWGSQNAGDVFSPHDSANVLHWVVVRGYNARAKTFHVLDNGWPVEWSYEYFKSLMDYGLDAHYEFGFAVVGAQKGSIIYKS